MKISLIAALDKNRVIGKNNDLPWRLPDDMKYFMQTTMGHPVIMGRKNFDSIPPKYRPLPGRMNIVLTRQNNFTSNGIYVSHDAEQALKQAASENPSEIFIIGGAEIYRLFIGMADSLYLTEIDASIEGDTFFPAINLTDWKETKRIHHPSDNRHAFSFDFVVYDRVRT
ncbi:MAG: dihydrofolate reductase [Cyclobacteriaceae bacterium]